MFQASICCSVICLKLHVVLRLFVAQQSLCSVCQLHTFARPLYSTCDIPCGYGCNGPTIGSLNHIMFFFFAFFAFLFCFVLLFHLWIFFLIIFSVSFSNVRVSFFFDFLPLFSFLSRHISCATENLLQDSGYRQNRTWLYMFWQVLESAAFLSKGVAWDTAAHENHNGTRSSVAQEHGRGQHRVRIRRVSCCCRAARCS